MGVLGDVTAVCKKREENRKRNETSCIRAAACGMYGSTEYDECDDHAMLWVYSDLSIVHDHRCGLIVAKGRTRMVIVTSITHTALALKAQLKPKPEATASFYGYTFIPIHHTQPATPARARTARESGSCTMVRIQMVPIAGACISISWQEDWAGSTLRNLTIGNGHRRKVWELRGNGAMVGDGGAQLA